MVVVYQAYAPAIAEPAVAAGRFVSPFKFDRMTWIKPSFLWTMYRSGWATKPDQERVLSVAITRDGFEWALTNSSLTTHEPAIYANHEEWVERKTTSPVRIQWDPERSLRLEPLAHRTIQIGLGGDAVRRYVNDWTIEITDVTALAHDIHDLVITGDLTTAAEKLPAERPYPLPKHIKALVGAC